MNWPSSIRKPRVKTRADSTTTRSYKSWTKADSLARFTGDYSFAGTATKRIKSKSLLWFDADGFRSTWRRADDAAGEQDRLSSGSQARKLPGKYQCGDRAARSATCDHPGRTEPIRQPAGQQTAKRRQPHQHHGKKTHHTAAHGVLGEGLQNRV